MTTPAPSTDERLAVIRRLWDEVWRDSDVAALDDLIAERYVRHNASGTQVLTRQELKKAFVQYQRVLHSPVTTVDDAAANGDVVFVRATSRGVNIETERPRVLTWMLAYRFDGLRITEGWVATVPEVDWEA